MTTIYTILIQFLSLASNTTDFSLSIKPAEIEAMKDASDDIHFHKAMEFTLPRFNNPIEG